MDETAHIYHLNRDLKQQVAVGEGSDVNQRRYRAKMTF
jgi:hypothetical protein